MKLNIATGLKEYEITDERGDVKCVVCFNPTDPGFAEKLYNVFSQLDKKDEEYHKMANEDTDNVHLFEMARQMDAEMRQMIDNVLGAEVCKPLFGSVSVYAWADGLPLWANLLLSLMDEMDEALAREKKASDPRLKKYTEKFKNKAG